MSSKGNASLGGLLRGFQELGSVLCLGWGGGAGQKQMGQLRPRLRGAYCLRPCFQGEVPPSLALELPLFT